MGMGGHPMIFFVYDDDFGVFRIPHPIPGPVSGWWLQIFTAGWWFGS